MLPLFSRYLKLILSKNLIDFESFFRYGDRSSANHRDHPLHLPPGKKIFFPLSFRRLGGFCFALNAKTYSNTEYIIAITKTEYRTTSIRAFAIALVNECEKFKILGIEEFSGISCISCFDWNFVVGHCILLSTKTRAVPDES